MRSPYVISGYVSGDRFHGRRNVISEIVDREHRVLYLMGTRQIGKTSLLRHVETLAPSVFLDLHLTGPQPDELIRQLLRELRNKREQMKWLPEAVVAGAVHDLFDLLAMLDEAAQRAGATPLLLVDEADRLLSLGRTNPNTLQKLRAVLHRSGALCTVLAATKRLTNLVQLCKTWEVSPFLDGVAVAYLSGFTPTEAEACVRQSQLPNPIDTSSDMLEGIYGLTNGHPLLLQLVCRRLLVTDRLRPITNEDLAAITSRVMNLGLFSNDFDGLTAVERRILQLTSGRQVITLSELDARLNIPGLLYYLKVLTELGFLRHLADGYAIGNHFLREWLELEAPWEEMSKIAEDGAEETYRSTICLDRVSEVKSAVVERVEDETSAYVSQQGYTRILHISDIHRAPTARTSNRTLLGRLLDDINHTYHEDNTKLAIGDEPRLGTPDIIVLSGDLTQRAEESEFTLALEFLEELLPLVGNDRRRVIVVPGNHDVNWSIAARSFTRATKKDYNAQPQTGEPRKELVKRASDGTYWLKDLPSYQERFRPFKAFFDTFYDGCYTYALAAERMFTVYDLSDLFGLAIVGFNSCDEIDARLQKGKPISLDRRARLNTDAVYNAKSEMDSIMNSPNLLRIAVFHHNIRSVDYREDYLAPMYVNILKQQRYNLCLHGHVHTLSRDSLDTVRAQALPIVGAGSLAAPYTERPPSAPMGYNLIVVARHTKGIWCHTRRCDESTLVWEADYRWGGRPFFSACSP